jgi:hypothetical protein
MAELRSPIPEAYKTELHYVDSKDSRSDAEIIDSLTNMFPSRPKKPLDVLVRGCKENAKLVPAQCY